MATSKLEMRQAEKPQSDREVPDESLDAATHRRILNFINAAVEPEDLTVERVAVVGEGGAEENEGEAHRQPRRLLEADAARKIIEFRDREFPLGLRNLNEIKSAGVLDTSALNPLLHYFSRTFFGEWQIFLHPIPRRGPGGYDGIVHAAMLRTGKVLPRQASQLGVSGQLHRYADTPKSSGRWARTLASPVGGMYQRVTGLLFKEGPRGRRSDRADGQRSFGAALTVEGAYERHSVRQSPHRHPRGGG
jgi:hypothetical protein